MQNFHPLSSSALSSILEECGSIINTEGLLSFGPISSLFRDCIESAPSGSTSVTISNTVLSSSISALSSPVLFGVYSPPGLLEVSSSVHAVVGSVLTSPAILSLVSSIDSGLSISVIIQDTTLNSESSIQNNPLIYGRITNPGLLESNSQLVAGSLTIITNSGLFELSSSISNTNPILVVNTDTGLLESTLELLDAGVRTNVLIDSGLLDTSTVLHGRRTNPILSVEPILSSTPPKIDVYVDEGLLSTSVELIGNLISTVITESGLLNTNQSLNATVAISRVTNPGLLVSNSSITGYSRLSSVTNPGLFESSSELLNNTNIISVSVSNNRFVLQSNLESELEYSSVGAAPGLLESVSNLNFGQVYVNIITSTGTLSTTAEQVGLYNISVESIEGLLQLSANIDTESYISAITNSGLLNTLSSVINQEQHNSRVTNPGLIITGISLVNSDIIITVETSNSLLSVVSNIYGRGIGREKEWLIVDPPNITSLTQQNNIASVSPVGNIFSIDTQGRIYSITEDYSIKRGINGKPSL